MPSSNARMRQPAGAGGDVDAAHLDAVHHLVEALARLAAEDGVRRQAQAVHHQLGGVDALVAHLLDLARDGQARTDLAEPRGLLDQERRHLLVDAGALGCLARSEDQHGDQRGRAAVRQPHLLAVQHVLVAVADRLARDGRDIRAAARLRHRERTPNLARRHPRQVVVLLLLGAVLHQHVRHDEVRVDDAADRHPAARDLLHHQGVGEQRLPEAAVLLRDHQPEDAHLLQLVHDRLRVLVRVLELVGHRDDLVVHEVVHCSEDVALVVGQTLGLGKAWHVRPPASRTSWCGPCRRPGPWRTRRGPSCARPRRSSRRRA